MNNLKKKIAACINTASESIPKSWPLYAFVTSNPLAGFEQMPFDEAVARAQKLFGANGYPSAAFFRQAWERKEIKPEIITELLEQNNILQSPEASLLEIASAEKAEKSEENQNRELDRLTVKWLSVFLDQGLTEWEMPGREKGFYAAWLSLAPYDKEIKGAKKLGKLPTDKFEALESLLADYEQNSWEDIFQYHLAALPGWTGFIKHRLESESDWQERYPVCLADYLAVRLSLAKQLGLAFTPVPAEAEANTPEIRLQKIWLKAWEFSFQKQFLKSIAWSIQDEQEKEQHGSMPDAQMVFCIDTRSELIRRHVEQAGHYETFGYAGFFGIAMDYQDFDSGLNRKSCPPILTSAYLVNERPKNNKAQEAHKFHQHQSLSKGLKNFINSLKKNVPASFGFVEGAGAFYGFSLLGRTLFPKAAHGLGEKFRAAQPAFESFCEPELKPVCKGDTSQEGLAVQMSLQEKVNIAKGAFDLMGWRNFAPLVAFIGHGSHTTNNPFGSSLDCGACAASPGRHNARVLAMLCNLPEVRAALHADHGIRIPSDTIFLGGEHNTTTDEIILFDEHIPATHHQQLKKLKIDLAKAQPGATAERLGMKARDSAKSIRKAKEKATDWAETRPEWGLASNAAFLIGPRTLSRNINLKGRSFLHSYDWQLDQEGAALEGIMKGPVTVTQWINNHYYFSSVDNELFGSGSKITQNITGKFGVVQGNGGDLKAGLPLQSLRKNDEDMFHQPLRLTVLIQAPLSSVKRILENNKESLMRLFEHEWIYLAVMDPEKENQIFHYRKGAKWQTESPATKELEEVSQAIPPKVLEPNELFIN